MVLPASSVISMTPDVNPLVPILLMALTLIV